MFGVPLRESLRCANVEISTANANGELYVWGYIPVVIAKWYINPIIRIIHFFSAYSILILSGLYLKEYGLSNVIAFSVILSSTALASMT